MERGVHGAVPVPADEGREKVIAALVANIEAMIRADRKITSLKQLQVRFRSYAYHWSAFRKINYYVIFRDTSGRLDLPRKNLRELCLMMYPWRLRSGMLLVKK